MAKPTPEQLRKAKDARQKKLLFALVPVFLLLLVWQGPSYLSMITGGGEEAAPPPSSTTTGTTPAATTPTATTPIDPTAPPSTAVGGAAPGAAPVAEVLPDTNDPATPAANQLVTFDLFTAKNPFEPQVDEADDIDAGGSGTNADGNGGSDDGFTSGNGSGSGGSGSGGSGSGSGSGGSGSGGSGSGGNGSGSGSGGSTTTAATLTVNGSSERVSEGGAFPASDPVFRLASVSSRSVRIGLVSGSFSSDDETIKLALGKTLTLVSQPDGLRYTIKLVRIG